MSKELEELKKSIVDNPTMKEWAKKTAEAHKTISDTINNSKGIHSLDTFYDTPKIIHTPPVNIDEEEWKEIKGHYSSKFIGLDVDMEMIELSLDNLYEQWKKGSYPDKVAFFEALDNQFSGYADMMNERKKRDYTSTELFSHYFSKWEKIARQIHWDGTQVDELLIEKITWIETDIKIYLDARIEHGLLMTDEMREYKGIIEYSKDRIQQLNEEPNEPLPKDCPPIEPIEDWNGTLYTLGETLLDNWETKKRSEEFIWCKGKRKNYFIWASHHYTYEGGETFTANGLALSIRVARSRAKID